MTISSTTDRVSFEGNGVTTSFPLPFRFFSNGDIQASLIDAITGLVTDLSLGVDYTLLGAGAPEQNGSPESALEMVAAPATGKTLFVQRVMDIVQPTDIVNQGRFFPEVHETVFDRLTMLVQQAALGPSRTIRVPESDPIPGRLPSADARATKVFGFDENGDPAVSSLSMSAIEGQVIGAQGFAEAAATSAQAAELYAQDAGQSSVEAGGSRDEAAAIADSLTGSAVPLFSVMWWPSRQIPEGYVAADGQTLPRATYPDAWAGIQAGNVPTVAEATWQSTNAERGKFTVGDGLTTFRLPDYNGKAAGSLGAAFLRGDGALSAGVAGTIQRDALQDFEITNALRRSVDKLTATRRVRQEAGVTYNAGGVGGGLDGITVADNAAPPSAYPLVPYGARIETETRPINVTGCWVIKLFGAVVNVGSADAAQLASDYANLSGQVSALPFTKEYVSSEQAITSGGSLELTHGLGVTPKLISARMVCVNPEYGYVAGNFLEVYGFQSTASLTQARGLAVAPSVTTLKVRYGLNANVFGHLSMSTGEFIAFSNANWRLVVRAWA